MWQYGAACSSPVTLLRMRGDLGRLDSLARRRIQRHLRGSSDDRDGGTVTRIIAA